MDNERFVEEVEQVRIAGADSSNFYVLDNLGRNTSMEYALISK
jgi:hypothetical protein